MNERSDPFGFVDRECGCISSSSEDLFLLSPFINDTPRPMPPSDAPILICSLPETTDDDEEDLGLGPMENPPVERNKGQSPYELTEAPPLENSKEKSPAKELNQGCSQTGKKKSGTARRRSKGAQLRLTDSDEEEGQGSKKSRPDPSGKTTETPKPAAKAPSGTQKLPETILKPMEEKGKAPTSKLGSSSGNPPVPVNLLDVVKAFSRKPDMRFANTDILEIAAMKGIHFPPPRWWRPGGYDDQASFLV